MMLQMCWGSGVLSLCCSMCGELKPLPEQNIDSWMGQEGIVSVIQGKRSSYDTTMFTPHFDTVHKVQECSHTSGQHCCGL